MRSKLEMTEMTEDDWEEEKKCQDLKKQWIREFSDVFKEDLGKEDRIDIEPIKIDLVDNHQDIHVFHPTTAVDISPYMEAAARKELARMLNAGMIEEIQGYTKNLSHGFFVEKPGRDEVKGRLVADFSGINRKLRRPEYPLEGSWGILRRLDPGTSILRQLISAVDLANSL